jgi:hypothetical protein
VAASTGSKSRPLFLNDEDAMKLEVGDKPLKGWTSGEQSLATKPHWRGGTIWGGRGVMKLEVSEKPLKGRTSGVQSLGTNPHWRGGTIWGRGGGRLHRGLHAGLESIGGPAVPSWVRDSLDLFIAERATAVVGGRGNKFVSQTSVILSTRPP